MAMYYPGMRKPVAIVTVLTVVMLSACISTGVMRQKAGLFVVTGENVVAWSPTSVQEEFTLEGFIVNYFFQDPKVTVKPQESNVVFNGDYRPFRIDQYVKSEGRWVENHLYNVNFQTTCYLSDGEMQVLVSKSIKEMKTGVYVLNVRRGNGRSETYAFSIP